MQSGEESICQSRRHRDMGLIPTILWRSKWQPTSVFVPGKFHGQWNVVDYSPGDHKESDTTEHAYTPAKQCTPDSFLPCLLHWTRKRCPFLIICFQLSPPPTPDFLWQPVSLVTVAMIVSEVKRLPPTVHAEDPVCCCLESF